MMNPVVHFEMPYDDADRIVRFYQSVFGWQLQRLGEAMGNYVLATTATQAEAPPVEHTAVRGVINGGFYPRNPDWPAQHPSVVIGVDDVQAAMARVAAAGGEVLGEPVVIPGVGHYVSFYDTERNRVSMLQPLPLAGGGAR
ncbi:MAG: VOC family protein [Ramlibacter sp.]|nr:VOC family protein [Ramlibacter sp.]